MKMMLGLVVPVCARAIAPTPSTVTTMARARCSGSCAAWVGSSLHVEGKHAFPIVLHARDGPAAGLGFIQPFVEAADAGLAVIGPFARGVGMMDIETEVRASASGGPLEHLQVAVR